MPDGFEAASALLPERIRDAAARCPEGARRRAEEFRLRRGKAAALLLPEGEAELGGGKLSGNDLAEVLEKATASSFHACAGQLRRGFLAARGGVRVGVCGTAAEEKGIGALRDISSLNIRIPRQIRGIGGAVVPELLDSGENVLILSPPGGGKTTFLRELVRQSADAGRRVGVCDERGEVAAMWNGEAGFDVGRCADVFSGAAKAEAAMLLLRGMNPQILAMDEITSEEDIAAALSAAGCGVRLYATAHAAGPEALKKRPLYRKIAEEKLFGLAVVIEGGGGGRRYRLERL